MPEIGEVARIVHFLRTHLVSKTIKSVTALDDDIVYGKVGCSATAFQTALTGRNVLAAKQQGKYFYLEMDKPPHPLLHLGMTGWMHVKGEDTSYYKQAKEKEKEEQEWPPRFMKFSLETEDGREVAFVDGRRLARIRLVDCAAEDMRKISPLKENGPDPVIDKDVLTVDWLKALLQRKRVPVKALLLDQANISGVGNWVADEVLYQARIHPEQYSNTFNDEQIQQLHASLIGVCTFAVECLADSKQFPEHWLMKYRWDKGKKDANVLPNGERIVHLKVGGRTSAIVPSVQKKTAAVAGDVDDADGENGNEAAKKRKGRKRKSAATAGDDDEAEEKPANKGRGRKKTKAETEVDEEEEEVMPTPKKRGAPARTKAEAAKTEEQVNGGAEETDDADEHTRSVNGATADNGASDASGHVVKKPAANRGAKRQKAVPAKINGDTTVGRRRSGRNAGK